MVGLTLAGALRGQGLSICVLESSSMPQSPAGAPKTRVSALSLASQSILQRIGAWQHLDSSRIQSYHSMKVWEKDSFGKIEFDTRGQLGDELGAIVENSALQYALWQSLGGASDVSLMTGQQLQKLSVGEGGAFILTEQGEPIMGRLVVAADGAHSKVRKTLDLPLTQWDYGHHALVATIRCERPHQQQARQIFSDQQILAFLPLWEEDLCSIVWSMPPEMAEELKSCDEATFNKRLSQTFNMELGLCQLEGERHSHPLTMRYARSFAGERFALVGDAAHTIHPLAGQGVNLGLLDAASLAEVLLGSSSEGEAFGSYRQLRPYERWRKAEAMKMIALMESFKHLFSGANPLKKLIRDIGMSATNRMGFVKENLIRRACGLEGDLPEIARPRAETK